MTATSPRYYTAILLLAGLMGAILPGVYGVEPLPAEEAPRPIAVITHPGNEVPSVTRSELARMFLKKQTTWSNGERCIPIDQRGESTIRREFSRLVLQTTVYEMKRYWIQETMTGNAKPPVSLESASTVKKYVQKLPGAVGYIYLDEVDESVRVLAVTDVAELALSPAKDDTPARERQTDQTDPADPEDGSGDTPNSAHPAPEGGDRPAPPGDTSP